MKKIINFLMGESNSKNSKINFYIFSSLILTITFCLIYFLNKITPLLADDFHYSFIFGEDSKMQSFKDILISQQNHYIIWGGRSVVHTIAQLFLLLGESYANIFNSIAYICLVSLIYFHSSTSNSKKLSKLLLINILLWFLVPVYGQVFLWTTGSANYLWGTLLILLLLLPYRKHTKDNQISDNVLFIVFISILAFFAGWTNENTAGGMIVLILMFIYSNRKHNIKIKIWQISGLIFSIIGYCIMILAPGNFNRSSQYDSNSPIIVKLIYRLMRITLDLGNLLYPLIILLIVSTYLVYKLDTNKFKNHMINHIGYFITGILSIYCMVLSPEFPERAWFGPVIYFIIYITSIYEEILKKKNFNKFLINILLVLGIFSIACQYVYAVYNLRKISNGWNERIAIITEEKQKGNLDIVVPRIDVNSRFNPVTYEIGSDTSVFPNDIISKYYEINSITAK